MSFNILADKKQINDIIIERPFKLKDKSKRCLLYLKMNNNISLPYIRTPRLRLYFSLSESKWNSVKLSLHPYMSQIKDFVKIIKELEKHVKNRINCKATFKSCLNLKKNEMKTIRLFFSRNCKIDSNMGDLKISDLKSDSEIRLLIKIPYIWFRDDKYGLYFSIQRVKYYPSPLLLDIDFWDEEDEPIYPKKKIRWMQKCPECTSNIYSVGTRKITHQVNPYIPHAPPLQPYLPYAPQPQPYIPQKKINVSTPVQQRPSICMPSTKDLLNMKMKLKKVSKKK